MDVTSYLLGKNASGGGGGGSEEYFVDSITRNSSNQIRGQGLLLKKVPPFTLGSNVTELNYFYANCFNLEEAPLIDTSNIVNMNNMHYCNSSLISLPNYNTSNVTNFNSFANSCEKLENVPVYDWSSATVLLQIFRYCPALTDQSLDNILQSAISATSYTGTKTFYSLIGTDYLKIYPAERIQALPHYQAFLDAGWTLD